MQGKEQIDQAAATREREEAALYRDDGTKLYSEDEHTERLEAIGARFTASMDGIEADLTRRLEKSQQDVLVAENADPTSILTASELESANARRPFVSDEVYTMELNKLADRCRAVLAQGDRPTMFTYALAAAQRVGERGSAGAAYLENRYGDGGSGAPSATDEPGAEGVREVVGELKARLDPHGQKERAAARKAAEEARGLKNYAYYRRRGARNAGELHVNQTYGRTG